MSTFDLPPGAGRRPKGLVKAIRYGVIEEGKSRIVIDTMGPVLITKSALDPKSGKKGARIRLELTSISKDVFDAAFAIDQGKIAKPDEQAVALCRRRTGGRTAQRTVTVGRKCGLHHAGGGSAGGRDARHQAHT